MLYSNLKKQINTLNRRSFFLISGKLGLFLLVGWKLFNLQILDSKKYKTLSKNNQIDIEIIYPLRGKIKDRNGIIVATNKKSFDLFIISEKSPNIDVTLNNLNNFINVDFEKKRKIIDLSKKVKKFERIKILDNISWADLEIIEANKINLPGIHLQVSSKRIYPYGNYFSHILGYINKPSEEDLDLPFISKMPYLSIGRTGIEKFFNADLIGVPGQREIEVNSVGREIREISKQSSTKGKDINLTIDSSLQEFIHKELHNHKAGSIVVMEINSGEIIAMASIPNYDPNLIIKKPNNDYWESINSNELSPLTNRCIQGLYSPGSIFKMIVSLAAFKKKVIDFNKTELCKGKIEFGDRLYHCWKTLGHGNMNIENAIKQSCDVFFYELSKKVGIDSIAILAKEFGLGQIYDFGFHNEKKGIIPSKKWKRENYQEKWYVGETLIAAIGQGYLLSTPLQLAVMIARIASNGKKIEPSIYKSTKKKEFEKINLQGKYFELINNALYKVVNEQKGTAFKSKSDLYKFSGKTGTSQVKKITIKEREEEDFRKKEKEWKDRDHAIFVGYMPSKQPKYAVSVIIEHGGSGASVAAPIAKNIFDYLHKLNI